MENSQETVPMISLKEANETTVKFCGFLDELLKKELSADEMQACLKNIIADWNEVKRRFGHGEMLKNCSDYFELEQEAVETVIAEKARLENLSPLVYEPGHIKYPPGSPPSARSRNSVEE